MTIAAADSLSSGPYTGNGATTSFDYDFVIFANTELTVTKQTISTGTETILTLTTDYTVSPTGGSFPAKGTITMVTAPTSDEKIVIAPKITRSQGRPYSTQGSVSLTELEQGYDKLTMLIRELFERAERSLTISAFSGVGDLDALRADIEALGGISADISTAAANITAIQDAPAEATAAAASASAASTSASNAASSASAASTSASNAASSASAASTSETNAATSASAAATSATEAETAAATFTLASQVEAEAGTNNTKYMSALRVAQAIASQVTSDGWTYSWHPYNRTAVDGTEDGVFWDHAVDGDGDLITSPDFATGYDYLLWAKGLGFSAGSFSAKSYELQIYGNVDAAYTNLSPSALATTSNTNLAMSAFWIRCILPAPLNEARPEYKAEVISGSDNTGVDGINQFVATADATEQTFQRVRISFIGSGTINAGKVALMRRKFTPAF